MKTLDLHEAAQFLRMHPETLRRLAASGQIPCAKPGKRWVFIDDALAAWLRSQYKEVKPCRSISVEGIGGCGSLHRTEKEYFALLKLQTKNKRKLSNPPSAVNKVNSK